ILVPLMMVRAGFVVAGGFASAGVSSCTSVGVLMTNDLDPGMIVGAGCSPADSSPTPLVGRLSESAGDAPVPMSELKAPAREATSPPARGRALVTASSLRRRFGCFTARAPVLEVMRMGSVTREARTVHPKCGEAL